MFFEAHRLSVFTPRSLDVDVVLDLMIHDLDVVLTFAKSRVKEVRAVGLPILSSRVDIANVRVEFESGCVANFTASRVSTERVRKLQVFEPRQYVSVDYARRDVLVIGIDPGFRLSRAMAAGAAERSLRMDCRGCRLPSQRLRRVSRCGLEIASVSGVSEDAAGASCYGATGTRGSGAGAGDSAADGGACGEGWAGGFLRGNRSRIGKGYVVV